MAGYAVSSTFTKNCESWIKTINNEQTKRALREIMTLVKAELVDVDTVTDDFESRIDTLESA